MTAERLRSREILRNSILFGSALCTLVAANVLAAFGDAFLQNAVCVLLAANVLFNAAVIFDLCTHIRRDFPMLVFVGSFDLLLLGRVYIAFFKDFDDLLYNLEADSFGNLFQALQIVTLSLMFCYAGYRFSGPLFFRREKMAAEHRPLPSQTNRLVPIIRQISVVTLAVSSIAFFFVLANTIVNVLRGGYLASFTQQAEKNVPTAISRLSMFFAPSFSVFLATLPDRKQMKFPLAVYAVYMLASLFTGRRNTFVCEALMLVIYFVLRDNLLPEENRKLRKKNILWAAAALIAMVFVLEKIAELRAGSAGTQKGFLTTLTDFIYSQGATFRVVVQTVNCWDRFDHTQTYQYLYFPFEQFAHNNILLKTIFGFTPLSSVQNMQTALTTHNYAHIITYMVSPGRYLSGGGFGTSFVAEAYVAYGMAGVAVLSVMIGLVFRFFASMLTRPWAVTALALIAVKSFVYIPRNFAFSWVIDVFNLTYLCYLIAVYLAALLAAAIGAHLRPVRMKKEAEEQA